MPIPKGGLAPVEQLPALDPGLAYREVRTGGRNSTGIQVEVEGIAELKAIFRELGQTDAPFLKKGLEKIANGLLFPAVRAAASSAAASFGATVKNEGVKGKGLGLRAVVSVGHPGARSMEFGRVWYYRGYRGRRQKASGIRFRVGEGRGQKARPYLGILKGPGIADTIGDAANAILEQAVEAEYERLCVVKGIADRGAVVGG